MTHIDRNQYWFYSLCGALIAVSLALFSQFIGRETYLETPEHVAWRQFQVWKDETDKKALQRNIELTILNPRNANLIADAQLKELALRIGKLEVKTNFWSRIDDDITIPDTLVQTVEPWRSTCGKNPCPYTKPFEVLNDHERLTKLLKGNAGFVTPEPDHTVPRNLVNASTLTAEPANYHVYPKWWLGMLWGIFSAGFAFLYFGTGMTAYRKVKRQSWNRDCTSHHPFRAVPDFILGWLLYLLWLPGYALGYALWGAYLLVTCPIDQLQAGARRFLKKIIAQKVAHDDYEASYQNLLRLRAEAERLNMHETVGEIDTELNKIRQARADTTASATKQIRMNLASVRAAVRAQREIDNLGR